MKNTNIDKTHHLLPKATFIDYVRTTHQHARLFKMNYQRVFQKHFLRDKDLGCPKILYVKFGIPKYHYILLLVINVLM